MLSLKYIREHTEEIKKRLAKKHVKPVLVDAVISLDKKYRDLQTLLEGYKAKQNKISDEIGATKDMERNGKMNEVQELKIEIKKLEPEHERAASELAQALKVLPNAPLDEVPEGKDGTENSVVREVGEKPQFDFAAKDYLVLAEQLDIIDTKRAAKVSGSRFGYLKGGAALLEFALIRFALDTLMKEGFIPVVPPVLVNPKWMEAMGEINTDEVFSLEKDGLVLVGTSEQSIGPMHQGETFEEKDLPRRYVAFSSCFRREAGSYGKDTKGILRVHQFDKIEMFSITTPEASRREHEFLLSMSESMMQALNIPYRLMLLCGGDLSRQSAMTYDIESWLPSQNTYRETHSLSNTIDFQANDLAIRCKSGKGKAESAHMLNGTAFAIGRTIIAILENYQEKDGSIRVPDVLIPYMMGMERIIK